MSPFFGINLIKPVLKEGVKPSFWRAEARYLCKGVLKKCQYFLIKQLLRPSIPQALLFACAMDLSSSSIVKGSSS
jgi:hypothetical protein